MHTTTYRSRIKTLIGLLFLLPACKTAFTAEVATISDARPPIFVYSVVGDPTFHEINPQLGDYKGIIELSVDYFNKPYLERLKKNLSELDQEKRLEQAFGCIFREHAEQSCNRLRALHSPLLNGALPSAELADAARSYASATMWALSVREQFFAEGYSYSVFAVELQTDPNEIKIKRKLQVLYMDFFSASADAESRGLAHDAKTASPRLGSKEARGAYWFSGSPPLIETMVASAPSQAAELLRKLLLVTSSSNKDAFNQQIVSLPKLRELRAKGLAACKANYCSMHVYAEDSNRLQLADSYRGVPHLVSVNRWGLE
jgi:hypothetical protein